MIEVERRLKCFFANIIIFGGRKLARNVTVLALRVPEI